MISNSIFLIDFKKIYSPFYHCIISRSNIKRNYFLQRTSLAMEKGFKRTLKKISQVNSTLSFGFSLTKKPSGSRMGKGKGVLSDCFTRVSSGSAIFCFKNKTKQISRFYPSKTSIKFKSRVSFLPATQGFFHSNKST